MMPKHLASYVLLPFVGRKNMPDADARTQTAQYPEAGDAHSAARELKNVLSLSLPSFYRRALRLLGNKDDAEDAVQECDTRNCWEIFCFAWSKDGTSAWLFDDSSIPKRSLLSQSKSRSPPKHFRLTCMRAALGTGGRQPV
jgi:hypothetical protein